MPHPYALCPVVSYTFDGGHKGLFDIVVWNPRAKGNCFFDATGVGRMGRLFDGAMNIRSLVCVCVWCVWCMCVCVVCVCDEIMCIRVWVFGCACVCGNTDGIIQCVCVCVCRWPKQSRMALYRLYLICTRTGNGCAHLRLMLPG
jgi:hypothetical protein